MNCVIYLVHSTVSLHFTKGSWQIRAELQVDKKRGQINIAVFINYLFFIFFKVSMFFITQYYW